MTSFPRKVSKLRQPIRDRQIHRAAVSIVQRVKVNESSTTNFFSQPLYTKSVTNCQRNMESTSVTKVPIKVQMLEPTKEGCVGKPKSPRFACQKRWILLVVVLIGIFVTALSLLIILPRNKDEKQQEVQLDEAHNCEPCGPTAVCTKINDTQAASHKCDKNADCWNTVGSYACTCQDGYHGSGFQCDDVDECKAASHKCDKKADCLNTVGSYTCSCRVGYAGNGKECKDVNECETGYSNCHQNALCKNTEGSYRCQCASGYHGNGQSCDDIDECWAEDPCDSNAKCTNWDGSYSCDCNSGFRGNGYWCNDVDECAWSVCHHKATCKNSVGSFTCSCIKGYRGDGKVCKASTGSRNEGRMITVWIGTLAACVFVFFH